MDNLHGADKPSLLLLEFLAQELAQSRLLVLGTYRDIEVNRKHPLFDTLGQLAREPRFRRISLKGLDSANVRTYIERTTGVSPMKELVDAVLERSVSMLAHGSRIGAIDFHSLEDRRVKEHFREWENPCACPPDFPRCVCGKRPLGRRMTRKPLSAGKPEVAENPRARSAKLRAYEKNLDSEAQSASSCTITNHRETKPCGPPPHCWLWYAPCFAR